MSFILNALKKAENKGFEKENIKIKKQVLILRRQARGKKIKICSLIAILLGSLLVGWFLGHFQYNQSKNAADLIIVHRPLVDKNELRESNDSLSEKHARVDHAKKTGELVSSYNSHDGVEDKEIEKLEYKIEEVNPPIPVRTVTVPVEIQIEEAAQKTSEQAET
ncbi:MAG: hypothetical protein QNK24_08965, partial [Desulfuromusa sp.]|nr:hypothetical protein [Desulfuromusa sp.]